MKKFVKMSSIAALSLSAILGLGTLDVSAQTAPADGEQTVKRERRGGGKGKFGKMRRGGGMRQ